VRTAIAREAKPADSMDYDRAGRQYFSWLVDDKDDPLRQAVASLYAATTAVVDQVAATHLVTVAFRAFYAGLPEFAEIGRGGAFDSARLGAYLLQWLGEMPDRNYPKYLRRLHRVSKPQGNTPSLGSLPAFTESGKLTGVAAERAALGRVGGAALDEFNDHVALLDWGFSVLAGRPSPAGTDVAAREAVRRCLEQVWLKWPQRADARRRLYTELLADLPADTAETGIWISAGMPDACIQRFLGSDRKLDEREVAQLALQCLAPSLGSVLSAAAAIATGTGWNKASILTMPFNPIVFEIEGRTGVASTSFISALKERAGHPVQACLPDGNPRDHAREGELAARWDETVDCFEGENCDGHALINEVRKGLPGSAVLGVIRDCQRIAGAARRHDTMFGDVDQLLAFPTLNATSEPDGLTAPRKLVLTKSRSSLLASPGVTFPAIRKSFIMLHYDGTRSIVASMPAVGHTSSGVMFRHYLTADHVRAELRSAVGWFQSVCQALVLSGREHAVDLGLRPEDLAWFQRLATASGMAAAFGLGVPSPTGIPSATLRFTPTDANLRDLFLTLWALRVAQRTLPPATWRVRCLPLFAAAQAIAFKVCTSGLRRNFAAAARAAHADYRAGRVALPPIEGA